jgi:ribosomal protein S12 methylthiotransferase
LCAMDRKPTVFLVSLGCAKNLVDSEVMLGLLLREHFPVVASPAEAEVIVVNTCAFIRDAKEEAIETILELAQHKHNGRCSLLVVSGCLAQRYGESLPALLPEVDLFIGTGEFPRIVELIKARKKPAPSSRLYRGEPLFLYDHTTPRVNTSPPGSAYVKIAEGCSHRCSFCVIPRIRGPFRSRNPESVVREVASLSVSGVKEVNLIAQDVTRYGKDLSPPTLLPNLLRTLGGIDEIAWVRLLYANPQNLTDELISVIAEEPRLCKYLDLPLQHINPRILKAMKRRQSPERVERLVAELRKRIPLVTIRTTLMVGFPGETETAFEELLRFVREMEFDRVGVFAYSDEEGTDAFGLPQPVPEKAKRKRRASLMKVQAEISRKKNQRLVGTVQQCLIERVEGARAIGRTTGQAPEVDGKVRISLKQALEPGRIYPVKITGAEVYDLKAIYPLEAREKL